MGASNLTTCAYIYKKMYSTKQVGDMAQREHPFFKMVKKEDGFGGYGATGTYGYAIKFGNPQGIAADFPNAQAAGQTNYTGNSYGKQLAAQRKKKYAVITLDGEAMAAADGDDASFLRLVTTETDGAIEELGDTLAFELYRNGYGVRGRRSGALDGNVVTLTSADDARNFKVGMTVVADDTEAGTSIRSGSTYVTAVDEDAGKITLNDASAILVFTASDYLYRKGDPQEAAGAVKCVEGLANHIPLTVPSSGESWRGIDRSIASRALAGVRIDDTDTSIEENASLVAVKINQSGKKADILLLNPINFHNVVKRQTAKVTYDGGGNKATVGFEGFDLATPAGTLRVISDPDCPTILGYVLNLSTWYIKHLGGLPHVIQDDGRPNLRQSSADGLEARLRAMWNLICVQPGSNGVFSI